jgi:exodeoxyribonuclease VII small subunit
MAKAQPSPDPSEHSFETALQRLEQIVQAMESDRLPLEDLIVRYEEGIKLVQTCEMKLKSAEKKIEIITRQAQGKPELAEFEPVQLPSEPPGPTKVREDVSLF